MEKPLLAIKNLTAWYSSEKAVLSNFSVELAGHESVGLIGLNGAGKTTLINVLSGLIATFRSEEIRFCGDFVNFRENAFKHCRYTVFAEDNSFLYFTFREYLAYVFTAYKKELPDVSGLIKGFHFEPYTDVLLKDLSTGSRKKAFLITAFALKPKLLLLDEPFSITAAADRVLVLKDGQIRQTFGQGEMNAADIREALNDENIMQGFC